MKRRFLLNSVILLLSLLISSLNYANKPSPFHKIVFFGDSLTDAGNLYKIIFKYMPKSPPYYDGRFANGFVWSDLVAQYYYQHHAVPSTNYAIGGEPIIFHSPTDGFLPYSLSISIHNYLMRTAFSDRARTLFIIWIGANDYLRAPKNSEENTTKIVNGFKSNIEDLIRRGGINFVILTLPDISKTPYSRSTDLGKKLKELIKQHNRKLLIAISELKNNYKSVNIKVFDANFLFLDFLKHPDIYNKKYNEHIHNLSDACWEGGYTAKHKKENDEMNNLTSQTIMDHMLNDLQSRKHQQLIPSNMPVHEIAHYIADSPALREVYRVNTLAAQGQRPCSEASSYFYWDKVHPSASVHRILSKGIIDFINENFTAFP